jgi:SPP1 gp7 family putative phage head morphogenesis protein
MTVISRADLMRGRLHLHDATFTPIFSAAEAIRNAYGGELRKVATQVGEFVAKNPPINIGQANALADRLRAYAELIRPWASAVADQMVADVSRSNLRVWRSRGVTIAQGLREEIAAGAAAAQAAGATGVTLQQILAEQVDLITSLPTEAAERVHALTLEALFDGTRAREIAGEILKTGEVTAARAMLIARTEVGRTSSEFTRLRAQAIGSTEFVWRTVHDADVRPSHRALDGHSFRWDDPPVCDPPNHRALPGAIFNCRCHPEPIVPAIRYGRP